MNPVPRNLHALILKESIITHSILLIADFFYLPYYGVGNYIDTHDNNKDP